MINSRALRRRISITLFYGASSIFFLYIWLISKIKYVIRTEIDGVQYLSIRDIVITIKKKRKHDGPDSPDHSRQLK